MAQPNSDVHRDKLNEVIDLNGYKKKIKLDQPGLSPEVLAGWVAK